MGYVFYFAIVTSSYTYQWFVASSMHIIDHNYREKNSSKLVAQWCADCLGDHIEDSRWVKKTLQHSALAAMVTGTCHYESEW